MANKRLSMEQINQMRTMVKNGTGPEDIAKHFNIAVSSVHNYKARFKSEGLNFPIVRGKRPTGSVEVDSPIIQKPVGQIRSPLTKVTDGRYKFIVNGTSVQISNNAKNINIDKDSMEINF